VNSRITIPVIAGLSIGILLIVIFTQIFSDSESNSGSYGTTLNNLNLAIGGLKESYRVEEPITFTLRVTGYGDCYQEPNAAIWNASLAFASRPIWKSGTPNFTCDPNLESDHFIDDKYSWGEDRNVTITNAGDYVFGARIGVNPAVQKAFTVTQ
jgi:hypothetical protein